MMIPAFTQASNANHFDASREPLRAIRDLISACEGVFGEGCGDDQVLRRAQEGLTALAQMRFREKDLREKDLREALALTAGALRCIAVRLPFAEQHVVHFTGDWEQFGALSIAAILDRANAALGEIIHAG